MPIDRSREPSPLASWRFGQGITYSRNEWTNQCTLLFHTSVKRNKIFSFIKVDYMSIMKSVINGVSNFFWGAYEKFFIFNTKLKTSY